MKRWAGPAFVVLLAGTLPLLAPAGAAARGRLPDVAALAVVAAAFRGTPDRAALLGVVVGVLAGLWAEEPAALRPFVLGATGYAVAHAASVLHRDRWTVRIVAAAAAVLAIRAAEQLSAATAGAAPDAPGDAASIAGAALLAAALTAAATPVWFAAVARWRLLAPLERSFRDV